MANRFIAVFWGEYFRNIFLNYSLPSQLSGSGVYEVHTTNEDIHAIVRHPIYDRMRKSFSEVKFFSIDKYRPQVQLREFWDKYAKWKEIENDAIKLNYKAGDRLYMPTPDSIFSKGTFEKVTEYLDKGYKSVLLHEPRVGEEDFLPEYAEIKRDKLSIEPTEMVRLLIKHMHPRFRSHFHNAADFHMQQPSILYWHIQNTLVARTINFHPIATVCPDTVLNFDKAIDYDFIDKAISDHSELKLITDSEEAVSVQVTTKQAFGSTGPCMFEENAMAANLKRTTTPFIRPFFKHTLTYRTDLNEKLDQSKMQEIENISDRVYSIMEKI